MNLKVDPAYEAQWAKNRRRNREFLVVALSIPALLIIDLSLGLRLGDGFNSFFPFALGFLFIVTGIRDNPRCPRCGYSLIKPTFGTFYFFPKKCVTCGLPRGAPCDPDAKQTAPASPVATTK